MTAPVIVGTHHGAGTADALALGRWLAEAREAPLLVAVVHPAPSAIGSGRVDAEWVADRYRAAERVLAEARSTLGDPPGVEYRIIASSSAAHGLHDLAEQTGAAMLVVGSRATAPAARILAGSTAERLLAGSVCPVAVTPAGVGGAPGSAGRIGVAYVDTPDGRAALDAAAVLARQTKSELRLVTVVAGGESALPFMIGDDAERAFLDTARETYERALRHAAATVPDLPTRWEVRSGDVVEELAALAEVDVLFCGSRGYGPARRVLLGGVSTRLLRSAVRPLVVVPRA
ncbi:universal stress protein [Actinoplanes regularis]|uniref:Nucleotide-binding universal stress protein, UspA family n=1 Tax=Actinoplanes regularis TaxID=52697 RepID=A0A239ADU0_9ACTN|nr:universal stress protein [Actinoplanes regularis]GIE86910.1 universal stress protein [Actinoplanes regularis]SNR93542.1 Nucleotide-binding universal stress protein, UspA family [Actinoplanes regularis]